MGLIPTARLAALAAPLLAQAHQHYAAEQQQVRLLADGRYQADRWEVARRVVDTAEVLAKGTNTRVVVTTHETEPRALSDWYVARGASETWIKDFKNAIQADRLRCQRFLANQFRLL